MKNISRILLALVALIVFSIPSLAQLRQDKLYIDNGSGQFTILQSSGSGTFTFPSGSGTVVTSTGSNSLTLGTNGAGGVAGQLNILDGLNPGSTGSITFGSSIFSMNGGITLAKNSGTFRTISIQQAGSTDAGDALRIVAGQGNASPLGGSGGDLVLASGARVTGLSATNDGNVVLKTGGASGTTRMIIDNAGKVGIGRTDPGQLLDIKGTSAGSGNKIAQYITNMTADGYSQFLLDDGDDASKSLIMDYMNSGIAASGVIQPSSGEIFSNVNATGGLFVGTNANAPLVLFTGGLADANKRMTILGTGEVGIGTPTPGVQLDLLRSANDALTGIRILNTNGGASAQARIDIGADGTNRYGTFQYINTSNIFAMSAASGATGGVVVNATAGPLDLQTNSTTKLRIENGGNVLIGNTTGTSLLSVGSAAQLTVDGSGNLGTSGTITASSAPADNVPVLLATSSASNSTNVAAKFTNTGAGTTAIGLAFDQSGSTASTKFDVVGTGTTWRVSSAGAGTYNSLSASSASLATTIPVISVVNAGSVATNVGEQITVLNASANNYGLKFNVSGTGPVDIVGSGNTWSIDASGILSTSGTVTATGDIKSTAGIVTSQAVNVAAIYAQNGGLYSGTDNSVAGTLSLSAAATNAHGTMTFAGGNFDLGSSGLTGIGSITSSQGSVNAGSNGHPGTLTLTNTGGFTATLNATALTGPFTYALPDGGGTLLTSGSQLLYGDATGNVTLANATKPLFKVAYTDVLATGAPVGAFITSDATASTGGAANLNAKGLTISAVGKGNGGSTGLTVSATGGTGGHNAISADGNVIITNGFVNVDGAIVSSGDIHSLNGSLRTNSTTRIDNAGNASITALTGAVNATVDLSGGDYPVTATDFSIIVTTGDATNAVLLPNPAPLGRVLMIKNADAANPVLVNPNGSFIDGGNSNLTLNSLTNGLANADLPNSMIIVGDGTNWWIMSQGYKK
jgi:hypothetical protein